MKRLILATLSLLTIASSAYAMDQDDIGTYAIVHRDGHVTDKVFRMSIKEGRWRAESRKSDGTWDDVTCEADCVFQDSRESDIQRFFPNTDLTRLSPSCVHNKTFAVCSVSSSSTPSRNYVFVALVNPQPIQVRLARLPQ